MARLTVWRAVVVVLLAGFLRAASAEPLGVAGNPIAVIVSEVAGGRTVRLQLLPLDGDGKPKPAPDSTVLVAFEATERLRLREFDDTKDVQAGRLKVTLTAKPLAVRVSKADGTLVQEIRLREEDGSLVFRT